ncbi:arylsulfatase [Brevibacterium luteolum]|uniref:arylsulfatase n=1 Tax=Brevibacterium luteolum TaxID=199591 RepID=UPI003879ECE4
MVQKSGPDAAVEPEFPGRIEEFASDSRPYWPPETRAPRNAPNVIVMLVDDLGFSDLGPYGSEIETPNIDRIAGDGWVFTNYRTAPMCSPARAALMTGLNPHHAGFGFVAHCDPGYPGFTCEIPDNVPTLAESLRASGYATFMVGKWHLTKESKLHDAADRSSWPLQRGFDSYFGSMDGFTSVHHPHRLVRDNSVVDRTEFPDGYFLTDELTAEAQRMVKQLRANDADKPFFLYYAHTAVHGPIQAKPEDIARFEGRYAEGWNIMRERRLQRQKAARVVPEHAQLPDRSADDNQMIPEWDSLSDDDKRLFAKHMEVYAAAVHEVDESVGRILDSLQETGDADNTIFILASDNGGSAEGGPRGSRSYFAQFGSLESFPDDWVSDVPRDVDAIGSAQVYSQYPRGWARVSNTPFHSFKSSTYEGGVHSPLIVSWPAAPEHLKPGLRDQFVFVSDLAPTILELVGVPALDHRHGKNAQQMDGQSRAGLFADPSAPGRTQQYFECVGNRGYIDDYLKIVSSQLPDKSQGAAGGTWELFDLAADPTESRDLAAEHPEKVTELATRWEDDAWRNNVFPLDDDGSLLTTRPETENRLAEPVTLLPYGVPLERYRSAKLTVLRSFHVELRVEVTTTSAGALFAHGDQGGGYLLTLDDAAPTVRYNAYGAMHRAQGAPLAPGIHDLRFAFEEDDNLRWNVTVSEAGTELVRLDGVPMLFGMAPFTGISVGYDYGSPVDWSIHVEHGTYRFRDGVLERATVVPGASSPHDPTRIAKLTEPLNSLAE